ncbi:tyrosine-type recombinase/integrase [Chitinibacter bivalviorum]|uniref:Tyrosine-type recombinase/integrase n=1 Tax=Chitinibacter bivalviorum TaxID=2739434 RepID=A0A7H9BKC9_9NEIS|nr:tyrosine-type recombinase/integrase [Chitinibacter bivalviorum]QLG88776.1 tyrosine-type recombinase/integrase [Chitinibacter bivalviorum]
MSNILVFPTAILQKRETNQATSYRQQTVAEAEVMDNLLEKFRRHLRATRGNSQGTVKLAFEKIQSAIQFIGKPIWLWTESEIEEFFYYKSDVCSISTSTLAGYHTYLRKLQNFLLISDNLNRFIKNEFGATFSKFVPDQIPLPIKNKNRKTRKNINILSKEECEIVVNHIEKEMESSNNKWELLLLQRDKTIFITLLTMGLRVSELVKIKIGDFLTATNEYNEKIYLNLNTIGKGNVGRCIDVLFDITSDVLDWYTKNVRWAFLKNKNEDDDLLFFSVRGTALSIDQVNNIVKKHCRLAGINKDITTHVLRHTYATHILPIVGPTATQRLLGHGNLATTLGTYYHPNIKDVIKDIGDAVSDKIKIARGETKC